MKMLWMMFVFGLATTLTAQTTFDRIYDDPSLASQNLDAYAKTLRTVIRENPSEVAGVVALRRHLGLSERLANEKPLYDLLESLRVNDFAQTGVYANEYNDAWLRVARVYAPLTPSEVRKIARPRMGITKFKVVGPFAEDGAPAHDDIFPPEVVTRVPDTYRGAWSELAWRDAPVVDPDSGIVDLHELDRFSGSGYYCLSNLVLGASDVDALLSVRFFGSGKVWLRGELLADIDRRQHQYPMVVLPVSLVRGQNPLLIKISGVSMLQVRITDRSGGLIKGLMPTAPQSLDNLRCGHGQPKIANIQPSDLRNMPTGDSASEGFACADIYAHHDFMYRFAECLDDALAVSDANPTQTVLYVNMLDRSPLYSRSQKNQRRRALLSSVLERSPDHVWAMLELAKIEARNDDMDRAVELLNRARDAGCVLALLDSARLYRDKSWRAQRVAALRLAVQQAGDSDYVQTQRLQLAVADNDLRLQETILTTLLKRRAGDVSLLARLASVQFRLAKPENALVTVERLIAVQPNDWYTRLRELEAHVALAVGEQANKHFVRAEAIARQMMRLRVDRDESLKILAEAYVAANRIDDAQRVHREILELDPSEHSVRRRMAHLSGEALEPWRPFAVSFEDALKHDVTSKDFPRADSAVVLDELIQIVYSDGSSYNYVHTVRKILTQGGVDAYGRENPSGEVVTARTVFPDGSALEPVSFNGRTIEFPGVRVGCYLDLAYVYRTGATPRRTLDGDRFYFRDYKLAEPFAISRWVVDTPSDVRLNLHWHNFETSDRHTYSVTSHDDRRTHVWDVRDPVNHENEGFMPAVTEYIPWVETSVPHDWRRVARELAQNNVGGVATSREVRAKALEVTENAETDVAKARAIYVWVNANITTEGDSDNPHQTLMALSGDRKELFAAMCRSAGVTLGYAVVDRDLALRNPTEEGLPMLDWKRIWEGDFETNFMTVRDGDGFVFVDLTDRLRPFGALSSRLGGAPVILYHAGDYHQTTLPLVDASRDRYQTTATLSLTNEGKATVKGTLEAHAETGYSLKEAYRTAAESQRRRIAQGDLAALYAGFQLTDLKFPKLDVVGEPLTRQYTGETGVLWQGSGDARTMDQPMEKLGPLLSALTSREKRKFDLLLPFRLFQRDTVRIKPPSDWAFEELPKDLVIPSAPLTITMKYRLDDGDLVITREMSIGAGRIKTFWYPELVALVAKIKEREDQKLKLVPVKSKD